MKIIALSDMHGDLPVIDQECDVVCICGDIVPLEIQSDFIRSISWLAGVFVNWCEQLPCEQVLLIAGNHDFVFEKLFNQFKDRYKDDTEADKIKFFPGWVEDVLNFPGKIKYLQDTKLEIDGVTFYGTPHIPELQRWAFYGRSDTLKHMFSLIPENVDVLMTHSPGKYVNDTGVSLQKYSLPEYGSQELTDAVNDRHIKYWICGHVHSGNHKLDKYGETMVANVSIKDENYRVSYEPLIFDV
jgi:Icc-related predicted phosphoesterase